MGRQTAAAAKQPTVQDLNNTYSDVLDDLNDAYWAANTIAAKDQLYGFIEVVTSLVTHLDAADLESRDAAYADLIKQVASVNKQLSDLQAQINTLISRINTASKIVSDVAKVISIAGKVFPGI